MDNGLLKVTYDEFQKNHEELIAKYGVKDGFIVNGRLWWEVHPEMIKALFTKYESGKATDEDFLEFYNSFGFGPKLYPNSFIENGKDRVIEVLRFLEDKEISASEKFRKVLEEESDLNLRGVGKSFLTLFLTSLYPREYAHWNAAVEKGLEVLKALPKRERGTSLGVFYEDINNVIKSIAKEVGEENLAVIDNYLYSLGRGYIKTDVINREINEVESTEMEDVRKSKKKYLEIQYQLVKIAIYRGFDVWVAINDREEVFNNEKFADLCLSGIPNFADPATVERAKWVDVIWFNKGLNKPARFFEIEHTTPIYSGLLRLNDILLNYELQKATIVVPDADDGNKVKDVKRELNRPTFQFLADKLDVKTYADIRRWYRAAETLDEIEKD